MSFERIDLPYLDQLSTWESLQGLATSPLAPLFLLAGGAASATIVSWLNNEDWSVGEYAHWMRTMDDTIKQWDQEGQRTGCWAKNPARRKEWLSFWSRFSKHYGRGLPATYVSDSDEKPARALMQELQWWGDWLKTNCRAETGAAGSSGGVVGPTVPVEDNPATTALKWGTFALVVAAVAYGIRSIRS